MNQFRFWAALIAALVVALHSATPAHADPQEIQQPLGEVSNEHDTIRIAVEKDQVAKDQVEIVLKIAPAIHWHKKLVALNSTGRVAEIECRDDTKKATMKVDLDKLDRVEFGKGCFPFNDTHFDYKISDFKALAGCRIVVEWVKD